MHVDLHSKIINIVISLSFKSYRRKLNPKAVGKKVFDKDFFKDLQSITHTERSL